MLLLDFIVRQEVTIEIIDIKSKNVFVPLDTNRPRPTVKVTKESIS